MCILYSTYYVVFKEFDDAGLNHNCVAEEAEELRSPSSVPPTQVITSSVFSPSEWNGFPKISGANDKGSQPLPKSIIIHKRVPSTFQFNVKNKDLVADGHCS